MHIAIVNLTNGGISGGYYKYLREILPRLSASPSIGRLDMISPVGTLDAELGRHVTTHTEWARGDRWQGFSEARRLVRALRPDVVYIPTARWVSSDGLPTVVMVQNMEPLINPGYANPWFERAVNVARRRAAKRACANATRIIAISDFVQQFLESEWRIPGERIGKVYHGVDASRSAPRGTRPEALSEDPGAPSPFLFIAGSVRPMRGIEDGVRALAELSLSFPDVRLVIAGALEGRVGRWARSLRTLVSASGLEKRVVWAGKLSAAEMEWCYENCAAFLMTSRVEACPNTALEAMQSGSLIISTTNPPMPEFFADGALYYEAGDAKQLAALIERALTLPDRELVAMRNAGRARARLFTWDECARSTLRELLAAVPELRRASART